MHGLEILTAKEYNLPILFVVMNNARLGMVYHGHSLQFRRTHPSFEQESINISAMAAAMNIPSYRVNELQDINQDVINNLMNVNGPAILEVALVDNNTPPMGDRVKFYRLLENKVVLFTNKKSYRDFLYDFYKD